MRLAARSQDKRPGRTSKAEQARFRAVWVWGETHWKSLCTAINGTERKQIHANPLFLFLKQSQQPPNHTKPCNEIIARRPQKQNQWKRGVSQRSIEVARILQLLSGQVRQQKSPFGPWVYSGLEVLDCFLCHGFSGFYIDVSSICSVLNWTGSIDVDCGFYNLLHLLPRVLWCSVFYPQSCQGTKSQRCYSCFLWPVGVFTLHVLLVSSCSGCLNYMVHIPKLPLLSIENRNTVPTPKKITLYK